MYKMHMVEVLFVCLMHQLKGWREDSVVNSDGLPSVGLGFYSLCLHSSFQLSIATVSVAVMPSSDLQEHQTHTVYRSAYQKKHQYAFLKNQHIESQMRFVYHRTLLTSSGSQCTTWHTPVRGFEDRPLNFSAELGTRNSKQVLWLLYQKMPSRGKHLGETNTANVAFSGEQWNFCLKFGFHFPLEGKAMFTHL